jgi:hypothetical protein
MTDYTYATTTISWYVDEVEGGIKRVYARLPVTTVAGTDRINTSYWFTSYCVMIASALTTGGVSIYTAPGLTTIPGTGTGLVDVIMFGK